MELRFIIAALLSLLLVNSGRAQQTQSTINPNVPIIGTLVEQSGPALRGNFAAAANDIDVLFGRVGVNGQRTRLTSSLTLYADSSAGTNNAACGLAPGTSACNTLGYLYNTIFVPNVDTGGQTVTLSFANNDTAGLNISTAWTGGGQVTVQGPGGSPPTVGIVPTAAGSNGVNVTAPLPARLNLVGFKVSGQNYAITLNAPGVISINNLNFGASGTAHINTIAPGAFIEALGGYTISGGTVIHWYALNSSQIIVQYPVTLIGTPAFSLAFAAASNIGNIYCGGASFSGSATGSRYYANNLSLVNCATNGTPNFLPGNSAGTTSNGSIYQ
jgi:hypothetical protein